MLGKILTIIVIFSCKLSLGQFTDSLILNVYDMEVYNFNFFRDNKIKMVEHYKYYYNADTIYFSFLEYTIKYDKKKNLIIRTNNKNSKEYYIEGKYGHPIWCVEYSSKAICEDNTIFDKKGNIVESDKYKINYDSLNRIKLIFDTTNYKPNCSWNKEYIYEKNKLKKTIDTRYDNCIVTDVIYDDYYYKSDKEFGYVTTFPTKWLKPQWKYEFIISNNTQKLETYFYNNNHIAEKYIDKIIK